MKKTKKQLCPTICGHLVKKPMETILYECSKHRVPATDLPFARKKRYKAWGTMSPVDKPRLLEQDEKGNPLKCKGCLKEEEELDD